MGEEKTGKRLFGTNGVRGIVGEDMHPELALGIGAALGSLRRGRIAVGRDTRTSGPALAAALTAGILSTGCDVVDLGLLPTPALQYIVRGRFVAGAMVTASHNPPEYNGLKISRALAVPVGYDSGLEELERLTAAAKAAPDPGAAPGTPPVSATPPVPVRPPVPTTSRAPPPCARGRFEHRPRRQPGCQRRAFLAHRHRGQDRRACPAATG